MLNITMAKKGIGTVVFSQMNSGEMVDITTIGGVTFTVTPNDANGIYKEYIANGFTVKVTPEKKVASPKKPKVEKTPKTREQSLTEKYGSKGQRTEYIKTKNICKSLWNRRLNAETTLKGINFHNKLEEVVKFSMQTWEDSKRSLTIEEIINNTISY